MTRQPDVAEHRQASNYYTILHEYPRTLRQAQRILLDKTRHISPCPCHRNDWGRLLPNLHRH